MSHHSNRALLACVTLVLTITSSCITVVPAADSSSEPAPAATPAALPASRTPGSQPDPATVVNALLTATSDDSRIAVILDVLAGVGIGVYTTDGTPVLFGAEKSADDFWLYDYEVGLIAASQGAGETFTFEETAAALTGIGITNGDQPLTFDDVSAAVHASVAAAVADPSDPKSFVLLVIRELGLRAVEPYDLATDVPASTVSLGALASFLVLADMTLPIVAASRPTVGLRHGLIASTLAGGKPVAGICDLIVGEATKQGWDVGKVIAIFIVIQSLLSAEVNRTVNETIHGTLQFLSIDAKLTRPPMPIHYSHGGPPLTRSWLLEVNVQVALPESIRCGALTGVDLPRVGPLNGVTVKWSLSDLHKHGSVECPDFCLTTGILAPGVARLDFVIKNEAPPVGLGPVIRTGVLGETQVWAHLYLPETLGSGFTNFAIRHLSGSAYIERHQEYTVELEVDIRIVGTELLGTAVVHGTIPLEYVPVEGSETGEMKLVGTDGGELKWTTTPGALVNCGKPVIAGDGAVRGFVYSGNVGATAAETRIQFLVDSSSEIELWTIPSCENIREIEIMSPFWHGFFIDSHLDDQRADGAGIDIKDWTFTGADLTTGGILATRTYAEYCVGLCTGESTFKLILTPVD